MNEQDRKKIERLHWQNTEKVVDLLQREYDLTNLHTVLNQQTADIYRIVIPRYTELCVMIKTED